MDRREHRESIFSGARAMPLAVRGPALAIGRWARRSPLSVDVLIAIGLAIGAAPWTVWALMAGGSDAAISDVPAVTAPWFALTLVAVAVGHAGLAWRRVRPVASFGAVAVAVAVQMLTTPWLLLPSMVVVLPSLYAVTAYGRGRRRAVGPTVGIAVAFVGTLAVVLISVAIAPPPQNLVHPLVYGLFYVFPVLLATWTLGLLRRARLTYAARMAELAQAERVQRAVTAERTRIAREMHDVIAHGLSVVVSQANGGRYAVRSEPARAEQILATIARTGQQALADSRGMLAMLRNETPAGSSGLPAVQPTLDDLPELLQRVRAAGMSVQIEEHGTRTSLATPIQLAVYRVVQESLTNALKHAGAEVAGTVALSWQRDGLAVTVTDDGGRPGHGDSDDHHVVQERGADPAPDRAAARDPARNPAQNPARDSGQGRGQHGFGQGLIGMRERVGMVGGTVSAGPTPGKGFAVRAWLPGAVDEERREDVQ